MEFIEIQYLDIEKKEKYEQVINKVIAKCFEIEKLKNFCIEITLTNSEYIRKLNTKYRKIYIPTEVLSFPMFEKKEIPEICNEEILGLQEILGDIIISIEQVEIQAKEYGHSFERELAYMAVHGFYHLMGYDHIEENDKKEMREKEENILSKLQIER